MNFSEALDSASRLFGGISVNEQQDRGNHTAMFIFPAFMDMRRRLVLSSMSAQIREATQSRVSTTR